MRWRLLHRPCGTDGVPTNEGATMSKSLTKFGDRQAQSAIGAATVELSLPLLACLEQTQSAFFGLCVTAGKQVLEAMMEADRTALCGPAGQQDAARAAGRAGGATGAVSTRSRRRSGSAGRSAALCRGALWR